MKPLLDQFQHELQDTRSRAGLTDHQAELRHQEDVFSKAVGALNAGLFGLRADLQPLAISNMVGTMKTMGIGDNQISEIIRRMPQPGAPAVTREEEDRRAATMAKWVNE